MASTPYETLGVEVDATSDAVRAAYVQLIKECHPDYAKDAADRAEKEGRAKEINSARDILADDAKRRKLDADLKAKGAWESVKLAAKAAAHSRAERARKAREEAEESDRKTRQQQAEEQARRAKQEEIDAEQRRQAKQERERRRAEEARQLFAVGDIVSATYQFIVEEHLGSGAQGEVYRVHRADNPYEKFVLKVNRSNAALDRFEQEAQTLLSLSKAGGHRHVVEVMSFDLTMRTTSDGRPYKGLMVLRYLPGLSLDAALDANSFTKLPIGTRLDLLTGLLEAVAWLHANNLAHRDVKTDNVLIVSGETVRLVLIDFGTVLADEGPDRLTWVDGVVGTPYWFPPEVYGHQVKLPVSLATGMQMDVYSTGLLLFETLTGDRVSQTRPDARPKNDGYLLPDSLGLPETGKVLRQATHADPSVRFKTGGELLAAWQSQHVQQEHKRARQQPLLDRLSQIDKLLVIPAEPDQYIISARKVLDARRAIYARLEEADAFAHLSRLEQQAADLKKELGERLKTVLLAADFAKQAEDFEQRAAANENEAIQARRIAEHAQSDVASLQAKHAAQKRRSHVRTSILAGVVGVVAAVLTALIGMAISSVSPSRHQLATVRFIEYALGRRSLDATERGLDKLRLDACASDGNFCEVPPWFIGPIDHRRTTASRVECNPAEPLSCLVSGWARNDQENLRVACESDIPAACIVAGFTDRWASGGKSGEAVLCEMGVPEACHMVSDLDRACSVLADGAACARLGRLAEACDNGRLDTCVDLWHSLATRPRHEVREEEWASAWAHLAEACAVGIRQACEERLIIPDGFRDWTSPTLGRMHWVGPGTVRTTPETGGPTQDVTLTRGFWIMEHEVTQAQWTATMGSNPSEFANCGGDCPVSSVSWDDIQAFIVAANARDDAAYRLPTEAQWKFAAHDGASSANAGVLSPCESGNIGNEKYRGEYADGVHKNLWTPEDVSGWTLSQCDDGYAMIAPVCHFRVGRSDLCDMHGNVYEVVQDWWAEPTLVSAIDPVGPQTGIYRTRLGGAYTTYPLMPLPRSKFLSAGAPNIGFRLVITEPAPDKLDDP